MKLNDLTLEELELHKLATLGRIDNAKGLAKRDLIKHYNKVCCRIDYLKKHTINLKEIVEREIREL